LQWVVFIHVIPRVHCTYLVNIIK